MCRKITVSVKICRNSRSFGATVSHPRVSVDRVWAMSREREQMCSLSVQSRAAGNTGRALDRGRRGDPSKRLLDKLPVFRSPLLHCQCSAALWLQPLSLSKVK